MGTQRFQRHHVRPYAVLATVAGLLIGILGVPALVLAAVPANDNFADATLITSLPFSAGYDNTEATSETGEPMRVQTTTRVHQAYTVWPPRRSRSLRRRSEAG